jgi:hypothetical protein
MKLTPSNNRKNGLAGLGHHAGAIAKLEDVAANLKGRWDPESYTIGDAVQACAAQLGVPIMEALRVRTAPLTVHAWQHLPGRTEDDVIDLLCRPEPEE